MPGTTNNEANGNLKDWTVMFFFAADNSLSPLIVSQVKAIKDAGFQEDTHVLVHFDPSEKNEPTRVYQVNKQRKMDRIAAGKRPTMIGDSSDSFVRNMQEDYVDPNKIDAPEGTASFAMRKALADPDIVSAADALKNFIGYSLENCPAKHYILFLVGHGMIVGNDAFLPDDSPNTAITLRELEEILKPFAPEGATTTLELLGLHSCSMSSIEVAYQLKGKANYLMASQGTSYVGSWPYRQLLKKLFNTIDRAKHPANGNGSTESQNGEAAEQKVDIEELIEKLYYHALFNSVDFKMAGYSSELSLCSLKPDKVDSLTAPLQALVRLLKQGLSDESSPVKELIQLAHLESQSYWAESYSDIYDFCRCLRERCEQRAKTFAAVLPKGPSATTKLQNILTPLNDLSSACTGVIEKLETVKDKSKDARDERFKALVVQSDHFGSTYQYSHGFSVYFPWCEPLDLVAADGPANLLTQSQPEDQGKGGNRSMSNARSLRVMENYKQYQFNQKMGADSWATFLEDYFLQTQRKSREEEDHRPAPDQAVAVAAGGSTFGTASGASGSVSAGSLDIQASGALPPSDAKPLPSVGLPCSCPTIKNFPGRGEKKGAVSMSVGAAQVFKAKPDPGYELDE